MEPREAGLRIWPQIWPVDQTGRHRMCGLYGSCEWHWWRTPRGLSNTQECLSDSSKVTRTFNATGFLHENPIFPIDSGISLKINKM